MRAAAAGNPATLIDNHILLLLGCPFVDHNRGMIVTPKDVLEDRDDFGFYYPLIVKAAIVGNGGWSENLTPLLAGVERYELLADFLKIESGAHDLALALLIYLDAARTSRLSRVLHADTAPAVFGLLNSWLKPAVPWDILPPAAVLAASLFGHAWTSVGAVADLLADNGGSANRHMHDLVALARPSFLPGLCPVQDAVADVALPDLEMRQ